MEAIRKTLPELPVDRAKRLIKEYGISEQDAFNLVADKALVKYYEDCLREKVSPKLTANWIQTETLGILNQRGLTIEQCPVVAADTAGLIRLIENNTISGKIAKDVLPMMIDERKSADTIVREKDWVQVTDTNLIEGIALKVIKANPKVVEQYKSGKKQSIGFLVGQVMKEMKGKANPKLANEILEKKLS